MEAWGLLKRIIRALEEQDMEVVAGRIHYHGVLDPMCEIIEVLTVRMGRLRVRTRHIIKILGLIIQDTGIMEILVVRVGTICQLIHRISTTLEVIIGGEKELVLLEIRDSHPQNHYHYQHHHITAGFQMELLVIQSH
jgi:hypothetical protein